MVTPFKIVTSRSCGNRSYPAGVVVKYEVSIEEFSVKWAAVRLQSAIHPYEFPGKHIDQKGHIGKALDKFDIMQTVINDVFGHAEAQITDSR